MLISEPRYAAQLVLRSGQAKSFDDAGCLVRYVAESSEDVAAMYFHHARDERWLRAPDVAFVREDQTPMGYGFVAVDRQTPGALGYDALQRAVSAKRDAAPEGGH